MASLCDRGRPGSGNNHAMVVSARGASPLEPPPAAAHAVGPCYGVRIETTSGDSDDARARITDPEFVLGRVGGEADPVSRYVPVCATCGEPMRFVVQLEQGPDIDTAFQFNGATAFAYACQRCRGPAAIFVDDFY